MTPPEPTPEHRWLRRMIGEWSMESHCPMANGGPGADTRGTETVRAIGDLWVQGEMRVSMPQGGTDGAVTTLITLGFDPARGRFTGTCVVSIMPMLWVYDGALDADGMTLVLETEGPDFHDPARIARYRDTVALRGDDHRILHSTMQAADGAWHEVMHAEFRRTA